MVDIPTITSRSNPIVKKIRSLRQRKARQESKFFIVEGIHHVGEAIEAGWNIETLVYAPDLLESDFAKSLVLQQVKKGMPCQPLTPDLFDFISEKDNPQGILAVVHQNRLELDHFNNHDIHWGVAAVSAQDPGNVGSLLRTMDSIGSQALFLLDGGVDPFHPSVVRASMGALFWIPVIETSFELFLAWVRQRGLRLIGSSSQATEDYRLLRGIRENIILLLGSEQKGLSTRQKESCEMVVSLPMHGRASSLNMAVAAGIILYTMGEGIE